MPFPQWRKQHPWWRSPTERDSSVQLICPVIKDKSLCSHALILHSLGYLGNYSWFLTWKNSTKTQRKNMTLALHPTPIWCTFPSYYLLCTLDGFIQSDMNDFVHYASWKRFFFLVFSFPPIRNHAWILHTSPSSSYSYQGWIFKLWMNFVRRKKLENRRAGLTIDLCIILIGFWKHHREGIYSCVWGLFLTGEFLFWNLSLFSSWCVFIIFCYC